MSGYLPIGGNLVSLMILYLIFEFKLHMIYSETKSGIVLITFLNNQTQNQSP